MRIQVAFIVIFIAITYIANAQVIQTQASIDRNECLIGDQITLKLTLSKPKEARIFFPSLVDTLSKSIEIINASGIDTVFKENNQIQLQQTLTITTFDTGQITIHPLAFLMSRDSIVDSIFTNSLQLMVHAIPVDTTKRTIFDIKPPLNEPFSWKEIIDYIIWGLIIIALLFIAVYVYLRIKKNKPILPVLEKPKDPPYIIALRDLDKLKEKKLWQKQLYKQYYTELTDIIRIYLEMQYEIPALESVSSELIEYLSQKQFNEELIKNMKSLFTTADFVKFAKAQPLPDENDWHLKNAYTFVEKTKPIIAKEEITEDEKGGNHE